MDVAMMGSENTPFALSFVKDANTIESESVTSMDVLISIDTTLKIMLSYIEGEIPVIFRKYAFTVLDQYRTLDSSVIFTMPWIGCTIANDGPDPVYIFINNMVDIQENDAKGSKQGNVAPLSIGESLVFNSKRRDGIRKIFLICDTGDTANIRIYSRGKTPCLT